MPKLAIPYEIKPWVKSQEWGVKDAVYEQFGFSRHNGIDVLPAKDNKLFAPFEGEVVWAKWMPNGGGHVLGIVSLQEYDGPKGKPAYLLIDYLHNERLLVETGMKVATGDLICITDNTGFSTGPHSHMQYRWVTKKGGTLWDVEKNEAHNSFDPEPYRSGKYARDLGTGLVPYEQAVNDLKKALKQPILAVALLVLKSKYKR